MPARMHDDEAAIDEALVQRLLAAQMPALAELPLQIVEPWGTDNAVWRVGDDTVVRLPRIAGAEGQVAKEARWLPQLAPHLNVAVPTPIAVGEPAFGYPYPWAVHGWIEGEPAALDVMGEPVEFAPRSGSRGRASCRRYPPSAHRPLAIEPVHWLPTTSRPVEPSRVPPT